MLANYRASIIQAWLFFPAGWLDKQMEIIGEDLCLTQETPAVQTDMRHIYFSPT